MPSECKQCGACCNGNLIVEASVLDVMREPLIAEKGRLLDGHGELPPDEWAWGLSAGGACPFLGPDNRCTIYATRPNECISFLPGEPRCAHSMYEGDDEAYERAHVLIAIRRAAGLDPENL